MGGFRLFSRFQKLASLSHCPDHRGLTAASHLHHSSIIRSGSPPPPGAGRPWRALFSYQGKRQSRNWCMFRPRGDVDALMLGLAYVQTHAHSESLVQDPLRPRPHMPRPSHTPTPFASRPMRSRPAQGLTRTEPLRLPPPRAKADSDGVTRTPPRVKRAEGTRQPPPKSLQRLGRQRPPLGSRPPVLPLGPWRR